MTEGTATSSAIHAQALTKQYGPVTALAGLDMTVPRGEVFGFLGPNGAGKTTSVKLFLGLTRPTTGEAMILGAPCGDRDARRRIGYLPELFRYQPWLTAVEVLRVHCELSGLPRARWATAIDEAIDTVDLGGRARDRTGGFSKGMQQRLGLAVALLGSPELVFLDEPTSALDPVGRRDVRDIIRVLQRRAITVFLNSHLLSEVEQICDRVAVVDHGMVIATGTLEELLAAGGVRVRAAGVSPDAFEELTRFGRVEQAAEWITIGGLDAARVPEVVATLVRHRARVYAVEPQHESLEDRFMRLLDPQHRGGNS
ncbi:MAG: ABC transporter ATP-binding protein [Candidatus Dormibacteria bacterium]